MNSDLELKTRDYWLLSMVYNGQIDARTITTEFALKKLAKLTSELSPRRKLFYPVAILQNSIIVGASMRDTPAKIEAEIQQLSKRRKSRKSIIKSRGQMIGQGVYAGNEAGVVLVDDPKDIMPNV